MPKLNHQLSAHDTILAREPDNCTGWNCLTQAEQFGIILSIAVISIILILAYMYYLGKLTQAHRELVLATRHRRHRRRTPRTGPPLGFPGNQQLAMQTLPNYPPGFMCQPMICTPAGTSIPQPQPFLVPGYYPQPPPVPITYSIPQQHPPTVHQPPNSFPARAPTGDFNNRNAQSDSSSPRDLPPRQPSWRQRLARAVGLPVGRASTISSSSESRTPRRSRSHSRTASENAGSRIEIRREGPVPTSNPTHSSTQPRRGSHDGISARSHDQRVNPETPASANELVSNIIERAQSTQTDAATVHSDDYEIIPNQIFEPPRRDASTPELHLPGTRSGQRTRVNDSSPKSDSSSDERFTVPSESSMQSDYSPDLRPIASGSLYPESNSRLDEGPEHTKPMATVPVSTSPVPRHEYRPDLISIASFNERLPNRQRSRVSTFLQTTARTLWSQATHSRDPNKYLRSNYRPRPRAYGVRDLQRRAWERRRITPSDVSDDEPSRPIQPPKPIHQGGGVYS